MSLLGLCFFSYENRLHFNFNERLVLIVHFKQCKSYLIAFNEHVNEYLHKKSFRKSFPLKLALES